MSEEDGSGVVHIAPGCGAEDFELGKKIGLEVVIPVDDNGVLLNGFGFMTGKSTKEVAQYVFEELEKRNKLYKVEEHEHSYPVCWRCKSEVVFKAVREWHINSDKIRDKLIEAETQINDSNYDTIDKIKKKLIEENIPLDFSDCFIKKAEIELDKVLERK